MYHLHMLEHMSHVYPQIWLSRQGSTSTIEAIFLYGRVVQGAGHINGMVRVQIPQRENKNLSAQKSNSNTVWYIYIYVDSNYSNIPDKLKILDHKYCKKRIIDHFVIILHSYLALNIVHVCFKGYHDCHHIVVCRPVYYYAFLQ